MAIRYTKKQEDRTLKNVADPWNISGIGRVAPIKTHEVPIVALCGSLSDIEIATYLDGNAGADLILRVQEEARHNAQLRRLLQLSADIDADVERLTQQEKNTRSVPLTALAATEQDSDAATCGLHCEEFVLHRRGIIFDEEQLISVSREHGWLRKGGTRIGDVGNVLETVGLHVSKNFDYTLADLQQLLSQGKDVIAVVDGGELIGDREAERCEDRYIGEIPDHAVVVTHIDKDADTVEVYDPQSGNERDTYPTEQFLDAWTDSGRYLVVVE